MNAVDRRYLRLALSFAIEWEASLIDAHRTKYVKRKGKFTKIVPKIDLAIARKCRRNIRHFMRLRSELSAPIKAGGE